MAVLHRFSTSRLCHEATAQASSRSIQAPHAWMVWGLVTSACCWATVRTASMSWGMEAPCTCPYVLCTVGRAPSERQMLLLKVPLLGTAFTLMPLALTTPATCSMIMTVVVMMVIMIVMLLIIIVTIMMTVVISNRVREEGGGQQQGQGVMSVKTHWVPGTPQLKGGRGGGGG